MEDLLVSSLISHTYFDNLMLSTTDFPKWFFYHPKIFFPHFFIQFSCKGGWTIYIYIFGGGLECIDYIACERGDPSKKKKKEKNVCLKYDTKLHLIVRYDFGTFGCMEDLLDIKSYLLQSTRKAEMSEKGTHKVDQNHKNTNFCTNQ